MSERLLVGLFCGSVLYLTLFYQLGNLAFVGPDEVRYARIGQEMNLRSEYTTPTLEFRPWLEKPPLLFWLEAASFKLFGIHEWSARLPVTLLALGAAFGLGLFVRAVENQRAAILTLLILCTSGLFFIYARAASPDMPMVAALTVAMVSGFQAARSRAPGWAASAGFSLALAVLAKGPVALLLFASVFLLHFLLRERLEWSRGQMLLMVGCFLLLTVPWYAFVWQENRASFVSTFWINHHLARYLTDIHHHGQPFWYYLPILVVGFFPWVFFLGTTPLRLWHRRRQLLKESCSSELFLWLWALVPLFFFSLSRSKLPGYILPVIPPLAAMVGVEWDRWLRGDIIIHRAARRQLALLLLFALLLAGGLMWGFHALYEAPVVGFLLALPILGGVLWACAEFHRRRLLPLFLSLVAGMTLFAALAFWKAAPVVDNYHSARDLCREILPWISRRKPLILYQYFHHTADYYTGYQATRQRLAFPEDLANYFRSHPQDRYYVLTQEGGWYDLRVTFTHHRLLRRQGNLYLVEIVSQEGKVATRLPWFP